MTIASILPEPVFPLDPLTRFMLVVLVILFLPRFTERLRLPGLVGLIIGGMIMGPHALGVITPESDVVHFMAEVGMLLVMFFAGLEIDLEKFARTGHKSLAYGLATFLLPLGTGLMIGRLFGFTWNTSVLVGSLLASHTLLALPILLKHGIVRRESVSVTIGATMFTDIAALVVLAVCVSVHTVGFSGSVLAVRFAGMLLYIPLILVGTRRLAPFCLRKMRERGNSQVLYILLLVTVAAVGAQAIHLEGIVGAFIVGLAVGEVVREGPTREKLDTLGNTLFVPMFFLMVGTMIDPFSFLRLSWPGIGFMLAIVGGLILAKFLAAAIAGRALGYGRNDALCMWSLSIPQVAATMAAALVAYEAVNPSGVRLIDEPTLDGVLVLVMVTSILGPILTQRFAKRL